MAAAEPRYLQPSDVGIGQLFDRVRDAVVVGDARSGQIVLWNEAAETMFGYTPLEALGLSIEDLVPPELRERHRQGLARYAAEGRGRLIDSGQLIELPAIQKDGTRITVEFSLTPLEAGPYDPDGRYVLAILRDVTERRAAERELSQAHGTLSRALVREREAAVRLRELDEFRTTFIAMVAHDVRSPMATILGYAELLEEGTQLTAEQQRDAIAAIQRAAQRVSRLAEDMLVTAALESGHVEVRVETLKLREIIEEVCSAVRSVHTEAQCEIGIDGDLRVQADRDRLVQVLTNLISNAARFAPQGSAVEISARQASNDVELRVRDEGPGIASADVPKLFQRFARIGAREAESTGLGLWIARELMRLMNGTLEYAAGSPGAVFVLRLPAA